MKTTTSPRLRFSVVRHLPLALAPALLASCVVQEPVPVYYRPGAPRPPVAVHETYITTLPRGARVVYVRGERCWVHNGVYYRWHAHRRCYVTFRP